MKNLALQKVRPGSSILLGSSFRLEPGMQSAELQINTQNRLLTVALFPNGSHSGYMGPRGDLFYMWIIPHFVQSLRFLHLTKEDLRMQKSSNLYHPQT